MKRRLNIREHVDARDVGSCNFCNALASSVTVITSNAPHCNIQVRMCDGCLQELREYTR